MLAISSISFVLFCFAWFSAEHAQSAAQARDENGVAIRGNSFREISKGRAASIVTLP
jgi:hypothetical protein